MDYGSICYDVGGCPSSYPHLLFAAPSIRLCSELCVNLQGAAPITVYWPMQTLLNWIMLQLRPLMRELFGYCFCRNTIEATDFDSVFLHSPNETASHAIDHSMSYGRHCIADVPRSSAHHQKRLRSCSSSRCRAGAAAAP
jgi:hypothetical protein